MSNISKRRKEYSKPKIKSMGNHKEFLKRITKTLYYGELPALPCLSLPVTEMSCEVWSLSQRGRSLRRLHTDAAASISRSACVSPCTLVLALLYLERLKNCNPDYLAATAPADLFLVSLMVGNKFLQDDGEDDEVICSEWAESGGLELKQLKRLEVEFLDAIDWKVFVSDKCFETGLAWLERQVALKQAQLRGFFTYTELAVACETSLARALAYLAGLVAMVTAALLVAPVTPVAPGSLVTPVAPTVSVSADSPPARLPDVNLTYPAIAMHSLDDPPQMSHLKCCTKWLQHKRSHEQTKSQSRKEQSSLEPWWPKVSTLKWLYHSAVMDPLRRWLGQMNEYTESPKPRERGRCVRRWLNLSGMALTFSLSH